MGVKYDLDLWNAPPSPTVVELRQKLVDALKPKQKEKILELRERMEGELKPHHTDYFLVKWLRARRWDVIAAETMLRANLKFREEYKVDSIQHVYKPSEVLCKYIPMGISGEDRDGCPLYIFPTGNLDMPGLLNSSTTREVVTFFSYACEYSEVIKKRLTEKHHKVIRNQVAIIDMENFSVTDFVSKPAYELCVTIAKAFEANYPEILKKGIIINAPKIFTIFWSMIKPFLSEPTKKKIVIYGKDSWKEAILEVAHPDQIPKHWGGNMVDKVDGNPYCSSIICMGGKIPESYYLPENRKDSLRGDMKIATAPRQGKCTVDIKVEAPKTKLSWTIQTEDHDIGFGVLYNRNVNSSDNTDGVIEFVHTIERYKCQSTPEEGSVVCEKPGIYTLVFDNTYSWYRSKKVYYEVRLE